MYINNSDSKKLCLSISYLAPVEYYMFLSGCDKILLEQCDNYMKQTYRNRCRIATANGIMDLTIPVDKEGKDKVLTKDIRIANHTNWQIQHWRAIESAYNSTPFFEYYKDDFLPLYEKKWEFLWDFNMALQDKVLELLDITVNIEPTPEYNEYTDEILDLREKIHPKLSPVKKVFTPYYQVFKEKFGFIENLSIIDLLFNMGNESILILNTGLNTH